MSTITEYFKYQSIYQEKYGNRTVVLMQIGSFYEIYEYDPTRDEDETVQNDPKLGWSRELSILLNMILTSKSKNRPHSLTNPYMIGFPCLAYERHRDVILSNNYTIVRFDQSPNDPKNRIIGEIASAATEIDVISSTNQIVSIYIECQGVNRSKPQGHDDYIIISGMSCIDVTTGVNVISEVYSQENNNIYALQEMYRFLSSHQPKEIIVHIKAPSKIEQSHLDIYVSNIYDTLELNRYTVIGPKINQIESEYLSVNYQEQFMERLFPSVISKDVIVSSSKRSAISVIERLDLEHMSYGMISYIVLLQYCHEHNDTLIQRIHKPTTTWTDQSKHLILAHNAIHQLDIIPSGHGSSMVNRGHKNIDSLLSVLDNTNTSGGKRLLRKMLLAPITDPIRLNQLYGATEELMSSQSLIKSMTISLKNIPDLERLHRKLIVQKITPKELSMLGRAYLKIVALYQDIFDFINEDKNQRVNIETMLLPNDVSTSFSQCLSYLITVFNFDKLDHCKFLLGKKESRIDADESFFNIGIDSTLDQLDTSIKHCKQQLELICDHLNSFLSTTGAKYIVPESGRKTKSTPTVETYDDISVSMTTTLTRANNLKKKLGSIDVELCGNLNFTKVTKGMSISSEKISEYVVCLEQSQSQLEIRLYQMFMMVITKLSNEFTFYSSLDEFVSYIDYMKTNACNASNYQYHRPTINTNATSSYIKIEKARHPIIERILPSEYIPNNVNLGNEHTEGSSIGMLLYGVNSAGKSSLTKSIGLIIVMAQAGMFVPGILTYKPYTRINTRLSGNDDIFKGQSSFVVEMTELRNILKNASDTTLVLGDELCRGTESISGTSLTVATIETLVEAKSSFIFSTHMHHLPKYPSIETMNINQLRICHLSTYYDEKLNDLVYDRKLNDGPGSSVYGLEVCRSLSMDSTFIEKANVIRTNISETPSLLDVKKSRYNASIYIDKCSICGKPSDDSNNKSHHTHHIKEQQTADTNGFINTFHKNTSFNLIALCSNCHEHLHQNKLELVPKQTLTGLCFDIADET